MCSMTEWMKGWKKRGWVKADGENVQNVDLLKMLDTEQGHRRYVQKGTQVSVYEQFQLTN